MLQKKEIEKVTHEVDIMNTFLEKEELFTINFCLFWLIFYLRKMLSERVYIQVTF